MLEIHNMTAIPLLLRLGQMHPSTRPAARWTRRTRSLPAHRRQVHGTASDAARRELLVDMLLLKRGARLEKRDPLPHRPSGELREDDHCQTRGAWMETANGELRVAILL